MTQNSVTVHEIRKITVRDIYIPVVQGTVCSKNANAMYGLFVITDLKL